MRWESLNEDPLPSVTKQQILELQTWLIDHVDDPEGTLEFELRQHAIYDYAIHLTDEPKIGALKECDVVRINRHDGHIGYGVKVTAIKMKMSFSRETLLSDVHDWLNGWSAHW